MCVFEWHVYVLGLCVCILGWRVDVFMCVRMGCMCVWVGCMCYDCVCVLRWCV